MGLPLGPSFANIFLCHHEQSWISNCPSDFKPAQYYRYIDDTFLLFREKHHANQFLNYVNNMHPSIKFTIETECNNNLAFLDVNVSRQGSKFHTSVFRKSSFTGSTLSFFSFCCQKFKFNSVLTLINRAYNISSNHVSLHQEFEFVKRLFFFNGYPRSMIESVINNVLSKKYDRTPNPAPSASTLKNYLFFPSIFRPQICNFQIYFHEVGHLILSEY